MRQSREDRERGGQHWSSKRCFLHVAICPIALIAALIVSSSTVAQLLPRQQYLAIRQNSSGDLPFADFNELARFSGFAPSEGADQVAAYLAGRARSIGLSNIEIERFPSDGNKYFWAFRTEPFWEAREAELWLERPQRELLASFARARVHLARFSSSAAVAAELIDVGEGTRAEDYAGRAVAGNIVLTSGDINSTIRQAVWQRHAAGVVYFRTTDAIDHPDLVSHLEIKPWQGPQGEAPPFAFSLSYRQGSALRERLARGEHLTLRASVRTDMHPGIVPEVRAEIAGTEPDLPAVLLYAHDNARNTGGANNLTGVVCNLEVARLLSSLISNGALPRPRRTIRFMWGPEHTGIVYHFFEHPADIAGIVAMVNVDMIGFHQERAKAVFHLYRTPSSRPSFLNDVVEDALQTVGDENTIAIRHEDIFAPHPGQGFLDPLFANTGSHDQFHYNVERFWGPSDHEDATAFGVQAVLLNDFPDIFLGTQDDTAEKACDPTQMRRGVVIVASAVYLLASVGIGDAPTLLDNALTRAEARIAREEARAYSLLRSSAAPDLPAAYFEARNFVHQSVSLERAAVVSLQNLVGEAASRKEAELLLERESELLARVDSRARQRAEQLGVPAAKLNPQPPRQFSGLVPERTAAMRGPVNFFRQEYGRWWLTEKTGDEHFENRVKLALRGLYVPYEALNLADGKRDVPQIRDALSAEFEPLPEEDVEQYFRFLRSVGIVTFRQSGTAHAAANESLNRGD